MKRAKSFGKYACFLTIAFSAFLYKTDFSSMDSVLSPNVTLSGDRIVVRALGVPLRDLLEVDEQKTGIQFEVSEGHQHPGAQLETLPKGGEHAKHGPSDSEKPSIKGPPGADSVGRQAPPGSEITVIKGPPGEDIIQHKPPPGSDVAVIERPPEGAPPPPTAPPDSTQPSEKAQPPSRKGGWGKRRKDPGRVRVLPHLQIELLAHPNYFEGSEQKDRCQDVSYRSFLIFISGNSLTY